MSFLLVLNFRFFSVLFDIKLVDLKIRGACGVNMFIFDKWSFMLFFLNSRDVPILEGKRGACCHCCVDR